MTLEELLSNLEDRNEELYELMCDDTGRSLEWFDGARDEIYRTMALIKRHLKRKGNENKSKMSCV